MESSLKTRSYPLKDQVLGSRLIPFVNNLLGSVIDPISTYIKGTNTSSTIRISNTAFKNNMTLSTLGPLLNIKFHPTCHHSPSPSFSLFTIQSTVRSNITLMTELNNPTAVE